MLSLLAIAVSSSISLTVPYLPQTDALCGGAAAAMVFRYWGDARADITPFAPLVDERAGGIAADVLVGAIEERGWRALRFAGSPDRLAEQIRRGRPVIILVADRGSRYHYVVVTGVEADAVLVHDPTWGPSRRVSLADLVRVWEPTGFWSLVILPDEDGFVPHTLKGMPLREARTQQPAVGRALQGMPGQRTHDRCDRLLEDAIGEARGQAPAQAYDILERVRAACPARAEPLRELAGVRFLERRWREAANLAHEATVRDPADAYAWEVLASSRFLLDDLAGALRAWNQIDKPRVNLVQVQGLERTRFQTVAAVMGLDPNALLTEHAYRRAERRLQQLPDGYAARLSFRPELDGFATVSATLVERGGLPRRAPSLAAAGIRAAVDREARAAFPGSTGQGELWTAGWRWWRARPRVAVAFAAPRMGSLPGVWRVDGSWERQTYSASATESALEESRTRGALTIGDWLTGDLRYSVTAGVDSWRGEGFKTRGPFLGGSLERRWLDDRWSLAADATAWFGAARPGFQAVAVRGAFQSARAAETWLYLASGGIGAVGDRAPLGLWPGAGEGHARHVLLRAHPLLDGGVVRLDDRAVLGRRLLHATGEIQRWMGTTSPVRLGVAGFADFGRASRRAAGAPASITQLDVGAGLRLRIPGSAGSLRVDLAHGTRDGHNAVTVGWQVGE